MLKIILGITSALKQKEMKRKEIVLDKERTELIHTILKYSSEKRWNNFKL